jgi:hypothetical protein
MQLNEPSEEAGIRWKELLKVNHEVTVGVSILEIQPLLRKWGNLAN